MADLTISSEFINDVALATRDSSAALALPGHLSAIPETVFQSNDVVSALRESSAERAQRAAITASAIEQLAVSANNAAQQMTSSDAGLARETR